MKDLLESYDHCPTTSTGKWGGIRPPCPPFSCPLHVDLTLLSVDIARPDFLIKAWFYSGGRYYL